MNDVEPKDAQPISELDTTAPNPANVSKPPGGWQMPEPVFQQTSGYLPEGYIDQLGLGGDVGSSAATAKAMAAAPSVEPKAPSVPAIDVEPQPDLTEQLAEPPVAATSPVVVKQRSAGARTALIVLGLVGMVLFIAAFLAVVYFLFLAPAEGGSQF